MRPSTVALVTVLGTISGGNKPEAPASATGPDVPAHRGQFDPTATPEAGDIRSISFKRQEDPILGDLRALRIESHLTQVLNDREIYAKYVSRITNAKSDAEREQIFNEPQFQTVLQRESELFNGIKSAGAGELKAYEKVLREFEKTSEQELASIETRTEMLKRLSDDPAASAKEVAFFRDKLSRDIELYGPKLALLETVATKLAERSEQLGIEAPARVMQDKRGV